MRFTVTGGASRHKDCCTGVAAALHGEIISGGDDYSVWRWNTDGEPIAKVGDFDACVTFVAWMPRSGGPRRKDSSGRDLCVVGFADGTMRFISATSGRVEKVIDAHTGAVSAITFAPDGSTAATAGEDGVVKIWSQAGIQRSVLANCGRCVYALVWGAESTEMGGETILYAAGSDVTIKALNPSTKRQIKWKAHNGIVLCADWSRMSNYIVTGGEDGLFKVWDPYGRNVFTSAAGDHPVTSIGFAPDGELFAVGSFLSLRVCDKTGWTHCYDGIDVGSVMSLSWTADGTQVACAGGSGDMRIAQLVDRHLHWGNYNVTLTDSKKLHVQDVVSDTVEELEQRDKVIKISIGYGYLVVCTTTQCICYDVLRLGTPCIFDLRDAVITLAQTEKTFIIADCDQGISVYTYEGRLLSTIKVAVNIKPEAIGTHLVAVSPETVAVRDPANAKKIAFYDAQAGKALKDTGVSHHLDILELKLSHAGTLVDRRVAFVDRNRDLYVATLQGACHKLATMATSIRWHDHYETLSAISDGHLATWYLPSMVFIDRDLLQNTLFIRDDGSEEFTRNDQIQDFSNTRVHVRRGSDGALLAFAVSPYPSILFDHIKRHDWDSATRLCRFLNDKMLWSVLTALAVKGSELRTAGVGYGALSDLDKVRFVETIKEIPSPEGRQAELAVFMRRTAEAETILLQAGLVYRCIDMHIRLFNWDRAIDVAVERRTHVDTVVAKRQQYLDAVGRKENIDKFRQVAQSVQVDWDIINDKIKQEQKKEAQRPNAKPYQ